MHFWQRWQNIWLPTTIWPRLAAPEWSEIRVLQRPWFPAELEAQRADALVWAPAAFRKHGVYLSARDLEAA